MNAPCLRAWLLLCSSLTVMAGATLSPSLPSMARHFSHISHAEFWVKMVVSIPGISIVVSAFFIGKLLDTVSKRRILLLSLLGYGIFGCAGFFIENNLLGVLLSRAALGIAVAGIMLSVTTLATEYYRGDEFNHYMGLQVAFGSFGGVCFLLLSGFLSDLNWKYPFLLHSLALILLLFAIPLRFPSNKGHQQYNPIKETTSKTLPAKIILFMFSFLAFFEILLLYTIPLNFPFYLNNYFEVSNTVIGAIMSAIFLIVALTSANYSKIKRFLTFPSIHTIGLVLITTGFGALAHGKNFFFIGFGITLLGLGFGLVRPNLIVWLFSISSPFVRGRVMGVITSCFFLGQFASPFVFQPILMHINEQAVYFIAACLTICLVGLPYLLASILQTSPGEMPKCFLNANEKLEV